MTKKWDTKDISRFMRVMGIISSMVDVAAFALFWFVFEYNSVDKQAYFQTAWFVMCLISELLIIHNVRTSKTAFIESNASKPLIILTVFSMFLTVAAPILLRSIPSFHFVVLPVNYYFYIIILNIFYIMIVSIIKKIYIKRNNEWL